jgi:hypothetical protein
VSVVTTCYTLTGTYKRNHKSIMELVL